MGAFKESCCVPTKNVACMLNKKREEQVARNVSVIKSLMECVCMCGKQGLAFRGHRDDYTASEEYDNKGNFIELVLFRAQTDGSVTSTLSSSSSKCSLHIKNHSE